MMDNASWFKEHVFFILSILAQPVYADYDYGDPSAEEQAHLEAINRARANPLTEAERLGIDLFEGVDTGDISAEASQPLVSNAILLDIARAHSLDMLNRDYFAHNTLEGVVPFERASAAGYVYQRLGENIAYRGTTGQLDFIRTGLQLHDDLFIDENYPGRGHRVNILQPEYKEIGVGLLAGVFSTDGTDFNSAMITTDFGARFDDRAFITGVVYNDLNADGLYTAGEGLTDVSLSILQTGEQTVTASAGGYAIPIEPGNYTIRAEHGALGNVEHSITIDRQNIKLDIVTTDFNSEVYARFNGATGEVQVPAVKVPDINSHTQYYAATLQLVSVSPSVRFKVSGLTVLTQVSGLSVSEYFPDTLVLKIPDVEVSDGAVSHFSVELRLSLIENDVIFFDLVGAERLD